jgi:sec-independent protein translocase protein TatA
MGIGSLGISEMAVIFVIVLVFFGPRRFPEIARSMGSAMREFRRSLNQIQRELEEVDPRKDIPGKDILDDIRSGKPGSWLDPNQPGAAARQGTPGTRSAPETPETPEPQVTGEAGEVGADDEQLPMFGGSPTGSSSRWPADEAGADPEPSTTDRSRSD